MADELDYVNPIIQAMVAAAQGKARAQEREQQKAQDKEQNQLQKERLKQEQQRIDAEAKARDATHELAKAQMELTRQQHIYQQTSDIWDKLNQQVAQGADPNNFAAPSGNPRIGAAPITSIPGLGSAQFDPNSLASPAQRLKVEADRAAGIARSTTQAQQDVLKPIEEARAQRDQRFDLEKLGIQGENQIALEKARAADESKKQELLFKHQKDLNDADNKTSMAVARIRLSNLGKDLTDQTVSSYINDAYITGNISTIPTKLQPAIRNALPSNWTPINKADQTKFEGIPLVNALIDKGLQLSKESAQGLLQRGAAATGFGFLGSAGNTRQEVDALLGNIARIFGGEKGVLTQKDIERAKGLIYSLTATDDQNSQKIKDLEAIFKEGLKSTLDKYPPDQLSQILVKRGVDPDQFKGGGGKKDPLGLFK